MHDLGEEARQRASLRKVLSAEQNNKKNDWEEWRNLAIFDLRKLEDGNKKCFALPLTTLLIPTQLGDTVMLVQVSFV